MNRRDRLKPKRLRLRKHHAKLRNVALRSAAEMRKKGWPS